MAVLAVAEEIARALDVPGRPGVHATRPAPTMLRAVHVPQRDRPVVVLKDDGGATAAEENARALDVPGRPGVHATRPPPIMLVPLMSHSATDPSLFCRTMAGLPSPKKPGAADRPGEPSLKSKVDQLPVVASWPNKLPS